MTTETLAIIEQDCARLLTAFYSDLDGRRNTEVLKAFHHDAVWVRMGDVITGAEAIGKALADRFQDTVVIHSITNLRFSAASDQEARSEALVLVYVGKPAGEGKPASGKVRAVTQAFTDYVLNDGQWQIRKHDGRPLMMIE
jgi:hypothetical protein